MNARSQTSTAEQVSDIVSMDAVGLSKAIHRRDISCVEVLDAYLAQIDRLNPQVNAIVAMPAREGLQAQATERDKQLSNKQSLGALHGFPQAPKDIAPLAGLVTTNGSPIFAGQITKVDSAANARVR